MSDVQLVPPPGGLMLAGWGHGEDEAVLAADRAARRWQWPEPGPLQPGSAAHARATWTMFRDTFNPYKPTIIDWPQLEAQARERLINLPIWDIAVQTEGKARLRMLSYAQTLIDPPWHDAVELNGWEEGRHKVVLSNLVEAYGIRLEAEPPYLEPRDAEWAYLVTGFSECVDSFFPPELVETFEPVMQEECRHILLFANWLAAHRARLSLPRRIWFELRVAAVWVFLGWERIGLARGMDDGKPKEQDNNFTVTGAKSVAAEEIGMVDLMALCLAENDRRFAGYDRRLCRPTTMPSLTRSALWLMGRLRRRKPR